MNESNKKNTIILILSVVVLILVLLLCITMFKKDKKEEGSTTESSTVAVVTTEAVSETGIESGTEADTEATSEADQTSDKPPKDDEDVVQNNAPSHDSDSNEPSKKEEYSFRNNKRLEEHYEKHGKEMGFKDAESYEEAASAVVNNPNSLHKTEKEDGDDVYYLESTNEFVVVSTDGYIRTYFNPNRGIDYYNSQ